jgi:hypothetical protein
VLPENNGTILNISAPAMPSETRLLTASAQAGGDAPLICVSLGEGESDHLHFTIASLALNELLPAICANAASIRDIARQRVMCDNMRRLKILKTTLTTVRRRADVGSS